MPPSLVRFAATHERWTLRQDLLKQSVGLLRSCSAVRVHAPDSSIYECSFTDEGRELAEIEGDDDYNTPSAFKMRVRASMHLSSVVIAGPFYIENRSRI